MSANTRKFFGEAVARVANFPAKNCYPAKPGGDRKITKKREKPQRTLRREGMKILPGGHRTFARHASHGLVPPREIPVRNTKAQHGLHVDESPRLRAAKHYDLRHIESNQKKNIEREKEKEYRRIEGWENRYIEQRTR
ncbi:hypothetical protein ALC60_02734 [Trachymyrmex zeteki]|uniref:Uncharacterized protein n=1 Tax=Mycetomoellerius zeteki TaxID=64791 RepID=A0A151XD59_9HYME|nr:hypothetical protein ALC60_02734 [Trachymyrmex zeteki]